VPVRPCIEAVEIRSSNVSTMGSAVPRDFTISSFWLGVIWRKIADVTTEVMVKAIAASMH
jgi:hypothetical protein